MYDASNAKIGNISKHTLTIEDNDKDPLVEFDNTYEELRRCNSPTTNIKVNISGKTEKSLGVYYKVVTKQFAYNSTCNTSEYKIANDSTRKTYFYHTISFGQTTDWINLKVFAQRGTNGHWCREITIYIDEVVNGREGKKWSHTVRYSDNCW